MSPSRDASARLFIAWHEQEIAAALLILLSGDKAYAYREARATRWDAYGPGHSIFMASYDWAIRNGYREFDLLRGDEAYKTRWTSLARLDVDLELGRRSMFTGIARYLPEIRTSLSKLKPRPRRDHEGTTQWDLTP